MPRAWTLALGPRTKETRTWRDRARNVCAEAQLLRPSPRPPHCGGRVRRARRRDRAVLALLRGGPRRRTRSSAGSSRSSAVTKRSSRIESRPERCATVTATCGSSTYTSKAVDLRRSSTASSSAIASASPTCVQTSRFCQWTSRVTGPTLRAVDESVAMLRFTRGSIRGRPDWWGDARMRLVFFASSSSPRQPFSPRTVRTGTDDIRTTRSATLPRNTCDSPRRPCVPMTTRSASSSAVASTISSHG